MSAPAVKDIARELDARAAEVAVTILGEPTQHGARAWRWGSKGSLVVAIGGPKMGKWYSHEEGQGGDMLALIAREHRGNLREAMAWARKFLGIDPCEPREIIFKARVKSTDVLPSKGGDHARGNIEIARRIWVSAQPAETSIVATYFASRGLPPPDSPALRFHPLAPRGRRGRERLPAMIGLMRDPVTREPCGVHRTFLLHDGSDRLRDEWGKMMLGMRGVVMLDDLAGGDQLMIAEGIETACALRKVGFRPVWAATCAGAIAKLPPLPGVRHLTIFGDHDEPQIRHGKEVRAGLDAAAACAWEWRRAGREVGIILPRQEGSDWADVVKQVAA